jgi:hypothetical protein
MPITYPAAANTNIKKVRFLFVVKEHLRLDHNVKGQSFLDGDITEQEFRAFQSDVFLPREHEVADEIKRLQNIEKLTQDYPIDLELVFQ